MTLTLGVTESDFYGNGYQGASDADGVVTAEFTGTTQDLTLSLSGWDIDLADEVEVLLDGVSIGFLTPGADQSFVPQNFTIGADQQTAGALHTISFVQTNAPSWWWGVQDVLLSDGPAPPPTDMALTVGTPETDFHGNGYQGATDADGVVTASFLGTTQDLTLSLSGWDIDFADEVEVLLDGVSIGFLTPGADQSFVPQGFTIGADQQTAGDYHVISFVQTNAPSWSWGVQDVLLSDGPAPPPTDMALTVGTPETDFHGNGYQGATDADGVVTASFLGTTQDLTLSLSGWDIDFADEVEVLLDGVSIGFLTPGVDQSFVPQEFTIGADQQTAGDYHVISFVQTNAPSWWWGVQDVLLEEAPPPVPPTDPLYAEQWHLGMLGDIETIWGEFTGAGALVGVYDDGIEYDHVDLDDNYDATKHLSYDGSELDPYPTTDTEAVHGTAVSGVIAAEANGVGTVGVAWGATLAGVNIFSGPADINASDKTGFYAASDEQWQFDVVNLSWGTAPNFSNDVFALTLNVIEDWEHATATGRGGLGTLIVKAVGNDGDNAQGDFMNAVRHSISVGAYALNWDTGVTDAAFYTNRGANVLVSAPSSGKTVVISGTDDLHSSSDLLIATTDRDGGFGYVDDAWSSSTELGGFGGTSSATPVVSGVLALMLDANESLGWRDAQEILAYSAHHLGGPIDGTYGETETVPEHWLIPGGDSSSNITVPVEYFGWNWNGADNWNGGGLHFSEDYGYGGVDAYNAVRMAEVWSMFGPAQVTANEVSASTAAMTPALSVDTDGGTATPASASYEFTYSGAAMDLEHVDIAIVLSSTYLKEVTLEITSPEGTTVTLMAPLINDFLPDTPGFPVDLSWTFGAQAFRDEDPNGQWIVTLTETDLAGDDWLGGATGNTLDELELTFHGAAASDDDVYHYTSEMLSLGLTGDGDRVTLDDDLNGDAETGGTDWLDMAAMPENLVVDLATDGTGGASVSGGATFLDIANGVQIENAVTGDGNDSLTGNGVANELYGMRGDDDILGLDGNDTLRGGQGSDDLWGGLGDDLFEFHLDDEIDWIWDFTAGAGSEDTIALHGTGFMTFSSLSSTFADDGGNAVIDFGNGDVITLAGIGSSQLHEDDFLFYA